MPRKWRTHPDTFAEVWSGEIELLLAADTESNLESKTVFDELCRRHPGAFEARQRRALKRRIREWRAQHGPGNETFSLRAHVPGRTASIDSCPATRRAVTIAGPVFRHVFFQFVPAYRGWRFLQLAFGETFDALVKELQGPL